MTGQHFISYSTADGLDFALALADALSREGLTPWLDKRALEGGEDWDTQIVAAIRACASLLFVMTVDSVEDRSGCKQEWTRALSYKKRIIPLKLHPDAEMPFRLEPRQYIDFTGDFEAGMARLRPLLQQLSSPKGQLQALQDRLKDAQRDLRRDEGAQRARIQAEIKELEQQIEQQQKLVENPAQVAKRTRIEIERTLDRERYPEPPAIRRGPGVFVNLPPATAPAYFQGRRAETEHIANFLRDDAQRLLTIVGRGGIGKTVLVCRLLKALEEGRLPDDGGPLAVEGIVYLSANGTRRVNVPNLYADLGTLLPAEVAAQLEIFYRNPRLSTEFKMAELLKHFATGRTILLLDNFEDLIDPETQRITDSELDEALRALLTLPHHTVKTIITTRVLPRPLALLEPGRQTTYRLDEGLPSPDAENMLRARDADGRVGLRAAPEEQLREARERTQGYPRALEALYAILAADRATTLPEILSDTEHLLPDNVIEALVGEAFSRLDITAQRVIEALAVYNRPVTATAVDYLLQPYIPNIKGAQVLGRLVNMQFARKRGDLYYLHPVDRAYAFGIIPRGLPTDRETRGTPPYTQYALLHRGAEYFKEARLPEKNWKTIKDLEPQLAEFDLRCAAEEYDTAAGVLLPVDSLLYTWGFYRLIVESHEKIQDNLSDYRLKALSIDNLGSAYEVLGYYERAVKCHNQAIKFAREAQDHQGEGYSLALLGQCYRNMGQIGTALKYYEQSLLIAQKGKNHHSEMARLAGLGSCLRELGQIDRAIEHQERSLRIARRISSRVAESVPLDGLGLAYSDLGQSERAVDYHQQALDIDRSVNDRLNEGTSLVNIAIALIDQTHYEEALQNAGLSLQIGIEIGSLRLSSYANRFLALAQLLAGNLPKARTAAEAARLYNSPDNNHDALALLGIIALRQGDTAAAREAFTSTIREADDLLKHTPQLYRALDSKGLALCGLALLENDPQRVDAAVEAFREAREVTGAAGIVGRVVRLMEALAVADAGGLLAPARAAAGGEQPQEDSSERND